MEWLIGGAFLLFLVSLTSKKESSNSLNAITEEMLKNPSKAVEILDNETNKEGIFWTEPNDPILLFKAVINPQPIYRGGGDEIYKGGKPTVPPTITPYVYLYTATIYELDNEDPDKIVSKNAEIVTRQHLCGWPVKDFRDGKMVISSCPKGVDKGTRMFPYAEGRITEVGDMQGLYELKYYDRVKVLYHL